MIVDRNQAITKYQNKWDRLKSKKRKKYIFLRDIHEKFDIKRCS